MSTHSDSASAKDFAAKVYKLWQDQMSDMATNPEFLSLYKDFSQDFNQFNTPSQEQSNYGKQSNQNRSEAPVTARDDNGDKLYELMHHITFRLSTIEQRLERIESLLKDNDGQQESASTTKQPTKRKTS
ncbi:MAG: hypothetical protein ACTSXQ_06760 [Alphaproteobacteria bacterium]